MNTCEERRVVQDFTDLYHEYATPVYRFLLSLTQDAQLAEELTQETLYRAFININKFREESSLFSWLCQIAKNLYLNEQKKGRKRKEAILTDSQEGIVDEDWTRKLLQKEQVLVIHQVLHTLSEPYKEVFMLKVFGELKFKDIANLFGKTESWAKMTYYRSKEQIVKRLEENK